MTPRENLAVRTDSQHRAPHRKDYGHGRLGFVQHAWTSRLATEVLTPISDFLP
jgi:hypothetical protein